MGLENLKSAFSNITKQNQTNLTEMSSQYSKTPESPKTDSSVFIYNPDALSQGGVQLLDDTNFFGNNTSVEFPISQYALSTQPQTVDFMSNDKAIGFSPNQNYMSPSKFTGVGGESPDMIWTNNSLYGEGVSIGEFTNLYDSLTNYSDYPNNSGNYSIYETATDTKFYSGVSWDNNQVSFLGDTYSYDNGLPTIDATSWTPPTNFTYQNSQYGVNAISDTFSEEWSYTNNIPSPPTGVTTWNTDGSLTDYYDSIHTTNAISDTFSEEWSYTTDIPDTGWDTTTWNTGEISTTDYYDSIHTRNAISNTFGGPVDFMSGVNSYYPNINPVIPGFSLGFGMGSWHLGDNPDTGTAENPVEETNYTIGTPSGYSFGNGEVGNSRYLKNDGTQIPTGTHTEYHNPGITFTGAWSYEPNEIPPDGTSWTNTGDYYDSIHTQNSITDTFGGPVDFMQGGNPFQLNQTFASANSNFLDDDGNLITTQMHTVAGWDSTDSNYTLSNDNTTVDATTISISNNPNPLFDSDKVTVMSGQNLASAKDGQSDLLYNIDQTVNSTNKDGESSNFSLSSDNWDYTGLRKRGTGYINRPYIWAMGKVMSMAGLIDAFDIADAIKVGTPGTAPNNEVEPYVVSETDNTEGHWSSQIFPKSRIEKDVQRIGKFLSSAAGDGFTAEQNILGTFQQYKGIYDPASTLLNVIAPSEGLFLPQYNFPRDVGVAGALIDLFVPNKYTEWLDQRNDEDFGDVMSGEKTTAEVERDRKPLAFQGGDKLNQWANKLLKTGDAAGATPIDAAGIDKNADITAIDNVNTRLKGNLNMSDNLGKGDPLTLMPVKSYSTDMLTNQSTDSGLTPNAVEVEKYGMPLYFKDLRDGAMLYFRAYLSGISETISPSWESSNYIGRSEPVYTYTGAEREVNFNLKLFANTKDELNMIYMKMNRLTSLCYPEYKTDESWEMVGADGKSTKKQLKYGGVDHKLRMKPPMTKFRLGELFGYSPNTTGNTSSGRLNKNDKGEYTPNPHAEMVGFIKSLSYTFPDNSPWEIQSGYRVPKYVEVEISYQVIHTEVPSLEFALQSEVGNQKGFYGINQALFNRLNPDSGLLGKREVIEIS